MSRWSDCCPAAMLPLPAPRQHMASLLMQDAQQVPRQLLHPITRKPTRIPSNSSQSYLAKETQAQAGMTPQQNPSLHHLLNEESNPCKPVRAAHIEPKLCPTGRWRF